MSETTTYNTPATFVNVKRVRTEIDKKNRQQTVFTFGLGTDKQGNPTNGLDQLIDALTPYRGKQINLDFRVEEKEVNGRKFPSAFVRVVEMIPKDQQTTTTYVPKTSSKAEQVKAQAAKLQQQFKG